MGVAHWLRRMISVLALICAISSLTASVSARDGKGAASAQADDSMLAHMVYFSLKDASPDAKTRLVDACRKYLKNHRGIVFFASGTLAADMRRDVNVTDYDVSLHIVFKAKADHDRYQAAEAHQQFIRENQANWAKVRVFDSYVK